MKILHVIPYISPIRGGPSQAIVQMVRALRAKDVIIEIVTTNDNGDQLLDVPLYNLIEYQQVPVRFFPRFSPNISAIHNFVFSSSLTTWLWQNLSKYDLLHIHGIFYYPTTTAMIIARHHKVPYIIRPFGQLCEWSLTRSAFKKQVYLKLIEHANLKNCQSIHFTSVKEQQEAEQLNLFVPSFVLPHGLDIPPTISNARQRLRQHFYLPDDEPIILFLSRLDLKKGLDYLIPALAKLRDQRFTFLLAGSGSPEYESKLHSLIKLNNIQDRTHCTGFVTGELKDLLLQGSDLFVLTSYSENFGVSVLEALASGLPAIVTPGVALADLISKQQIGYVPELNIESIAASIQHSLEYPDTVRLMGDRARQFIRENYTWERISTELVSVYQQIQFLPSYR
jgi:glycosyltransferase involved in cell wall biosynthesis